MCSGSKAPPPSTGDRNDQGVVDGPQPGVNPYPRPPVPIFDLGEIRERVENWKATVVSAPLSQLESQDHASSQLRHSAEEQLSPLNFPTVKRRKADIAKAMKRKRKASSDRDYTTSRYFRGDGLADRMSLEAQAVNRDAEYVTPAPRSVARRSNAELTPHSRAESPVEDLEPITMRRLSPTPAAPENIHQIAEAFLPPSFPSQLQTSTPPPCDRLIKPPVIPRVEGLFLSASLPSPPPFPRSQPNPRSASQPPCTPTRSRHDIPSPANSPSDRFKRRQHATGTATMASPEKPPFPSSRSDNNEPPKHHHDLDLDDAPPSCSQAPLIDLHQLASQRSRDSLSRPPPRVFALGSSPITPRTARGLKGKGRAMTMDLASPSSRRRRTAKLSRTLSSPPQQAPPQTQTPPLSPPPEPDFTFAPAATSTQQPVQGSQKGVFGLEACGPRGSGVVGVDVDVDVDFEGWVRDVPVVEAADDVGADVGVGVSMGAEEKGGSLFEGEKVLPDTGLGIGLGLRADEHV